MTNYTNYEVEDFLRDDFFIDWVLKNTPEHQAFWQQWLVENPDRKNIAEQARSLILAIGVKPLSAKLTEAEVDTMISGFQQQIQNADEPVKLYRNFYQTNWFRVAATVVLATTLGFILFKSNFNKSHQTLNASQSLPTNTFLQVVNNTTESKLIRMVDGSLAVLKPGSKLRYMRSFNSKREVFLNGEAFFEIHKNPQMPFLVHSHDMVIKVLGTSFTVKSLHNNQDIKVVVNTGRVLVYNQKAANQASKQKYEVILTPNQQVTYAEKQLSFKKEDLPVPLVLSKEIARKEFTFDNTPLSEIITKIDKAYDVNIEYDRTRLGNITLTASLSDKPLDEKVKLLCKAISASCNFIDGRIIISTD